MTETVWESNGDNLLDVVRETRTFEQLELEFRVPQSDIELFRSRGRYAGEYEMLSRVDGGFDAFDTSSETAGDRNKVEFIAPSGRSDIRPIQSWFVDSYEEEIIGSEQNYYSVELVLAPVKEKAYDNEFGTTTSGSSTFVSNAWNFDFQQGLVTSRQVSSDLAKQDSEGIEIYEVELFTGPDDVRIIEESCSKMNATQIRTIPDGEKILDDFSNDQRHFIDVETPDNSLPADTYLVLSWETEWVNNSWRVFLELARKP